MIGKIVNFIHPGRPGGLNTASYVLSAGLMIAGFVVPQKNDQTPHQTTLPTTCIVSTYTNCAPTFAPPYNPGPSVTGPPGPGYILQVHNVITRDTRVDISSSINYAAAKYGFNPVGYAALIGTESGINQVAPHSPIPGAGTCDYSGGLTQITVCTAASYPLYTGDGSLTYNNITYVFAYEQADANRDVVWSAKLVAYFKQQACWDFPELYPAWNMGPGYGCFNSIYQYPGGLAYSNYQNYLGWWNYAWQNFAYYKAVGPKPKPKPFVFPWSSWCAYAWSHHKTCATPWRNSHGSLTWPASIWYKARVKQHMGGYVRSTWTPRPKHGYSTYFYQFALAEAWPSFHTYDINRRLFHG